MAAQTPPTHSDMTSSYNLAGSDRDSPETRDDEGEPPHVPPISPSALPYNPYRIGNEGGDPSAAEGAETYSDGGGQGPQPRPQPQGFAGPANPAGWQPGQSALWPGMQQQYVQPHDMAPTPQGPPMAAQSLLVPQGQPQVLGTQVTPQYPSDMTPRQRAQARRIMAEAAQAARQPALLAC